MGVIIVIIILAVIGIIIKTTVTPKTTNLSTLEQPAFATIMPNAAISEIKAGRLPRLNTDTIVLKSGEYCHYIDKALLLKDRIKKTYHTQSVGYSRPTLPSVLFDLKGYSSRISMRQSETQIEEQTYVEQHRGILYITNRRIIFVAKKNGFDKAYKQLTAVKPFANAIELQFGGTYNSFIVPDGGIAEDTIKLVLERRSV